MRFRRLLFFPAILLVLTVGQASAQDDWTILVYLAADNNLDWYFNADDDDIGEMTSAFDASKDYNVVVQWDEYGNNNSRRIEIGEGSYSTVQNLGEVNMGDGNTLRDFVNWGIDNYPANHYFVITWDHGDGWRDDTDDSPVKAVCGDDQSGGDYINISGGEWRGALQDIYDHLGREIDIWGHDACLMGMSEVYYEANGYCNYFVASEETEPIDGWPYDDILTWLNTQRGPDPATFAAKAAELYVDSYSPGGSADSAPDDVTMSAMQLGTPTTQLADALDEFARRLSYYGGRSMSPIPTHRSNSQDYYESDHIDLYDFADRVRNDGGLPGFLTTAAGDLCTALNNATIYSGYNGNSMNDSHGSAIYYPTGTPSGSYTAGNLTLLAATYWEEYQGGSTVPVELVSFEAGPVDEGVLLTWETASESDNLGFNIYRQDEGFDQARYAISQLLPGAGTTTETNEYQYLDRDADEGQIKYWLEQVDFSGATTLFGPVDVTIPVAGLRLQLVGSNPVSSDVMLRWAVPGDVQNATVGIFDLSGRLVRSLGDDAGSGVWKATSIRNGSLSSGAYMAVLKTNTAMKSLPLVIAR